MKFFNRKGLVIVVVLIAAIFFYFVKTMINDTSPKHIDSKKYVKKLTYYPNGKLKGERIIYDKERGKFVYMHYNENGKLADSIPYFDDKINGIRKLVKADGKIYLTTYVDGVETGNVKCFYASGVLEYEGQHTNSKREGEWKFYFPNGKIATYEYFLQDERIYLRKYKENGDIISSMGDKKYEPKDERSE